MKSHPVYFASYLSLDHIELCEFLIVSESFLKHTEAHL